MGLNEEQKSILNQAKYQGGGSSFISNLSKVDIYKEPVLIIGLGGTGIDAMLRVKAKINETFKTEIDPRTGKNKTVPDNVKFIGMDTDDDHFVDEDNTPRKPYRGIYVEKSEELHIDSKPVGEWYDKNKDQYPLNLWVNPNLQSVKFADGHGAGGIRQLSRTCLFHYYDKIVRKIKGAMSELSQFGNSINVYIIAGLSGGTGSGTFLDTAYIIQKAAREVLKISETESLWSNLQTYAYFVTPDVSELNSAEVSIKYNGYAAMKELDYWMGIADRGERWTQVYNSMGESITSTEPPFSLVHFVSAKYIDGNLPDKAYDTALQTIAENIVYFLSDEGKGEGSGGFGAKSWQSNVKGQIDNRIMMFENGGILKPVGYRYGIIGNSGKILPIQDIMTCLASKLLDRMTEMWERHGEPKTKEVELLLGRSYFDFSEPCLVQKICANDNEQFAQIQANQTMYPTAAYSQIHKAGDATPAFESMLKRKVEKIKANVAAQAFMNGIENTFETQLQYFFENRAPQDLITGESPATYGPRFANDILVGVDGGTQLTFVKYCQQQFAKANAEYDNIEQQLPQLQAAAASLCQEMHKSVFSAKSCYEKYMKQMQAIYDLKYRQEVCLALKDTYNKIYDLIVAKNSEVFGVIKETLNSLNAIFSENMETMSDQQIRETYEGTVMSWYAISFTEVNQNIQDMLDNNKIAIKPEDLYKTIWENKEKWSSKKATEFKAFDEIKDFIHTEFTAAMNNGLEHYIEQAYITNPGNYTTFAAYIKGKFAPELEESAKIVFNGRNVPRDPALKAGATNFPGRILVRIPSSCSRILSAVTEHYEGSEASVCGSASNSRISFNSCLYGVPLYRYGQIEDLEKNYENCIGNPGLHLYESAQENWKELPALCPVDSYSPTYMNNREKERIARYNDLFEKAYKYGIIRPADGSVEGHIAVFAGNIDIDEMIAEAGNNPLKIEQLANEVDSYFNTNKDLPEDFDKYPTGKDVINLQHSTNKESAKMWFASSYKLAKRVEEEVAKYEKIEADTEKIKKIKESFDKYFIIAKAFLTNVLVMENSYYKYKSVDGEVDIIKAFDMQNPKYPEYELFKLIFEDGKLASHHIESLTQEANENFEKLTDGNDWQDKLKAIVDDFNSKCKTLKFNQDTIKDASDMIVFYTLISDKWSQFI